ncbi:MAG: SIS domain-containing protein [Verrucomicrobiales bacterium]
MSTGDSVYFHQMVGDSIRAIETVRTLERPCLKAASLLSECLRYGGKIMACGNGGSAADSCHLATELLCRFERDRRPLAAISLNADGSFLTAVGNDYSNEFIFSRQVEGLARTGDVLVVFSTSGRSPNILAALRVARERGVKSIALLGREGGEAAALADVPIIVPDPVTARIQEAHQLLIHLLCGLVERSLFAGTSPSPAREAKPAKKGAKKRR